MKLQLLVIGVLVGALGCGSSYSRMKSERAIPPFDELVECLDAMPTETTRVATHRPGEPAVRIAIRKTGHPQATGPILVFIHGAFSEASAWRYVAGGLGTEHALWLLDLPGCGASDKPDPDELASDGYGPSALAERAYQAVGAALQGETPERRVVLVGHSLGSAVVMRMVSDPSLRNSYAGVRERVDGLVLFTPLDVAIEKPIPILEHVAHLNGAEISAAHFTGILRRRLADGVLESYTDPAQAPREEVDRSVRILTSAGSRRATQAMILTATPRRPGRARPDWEEVDRLVMQYANIDVPVLVSCGDHDETLPASMSYKLAAQIPLAELQVIRDCMHSPHLERPLECAALIDGFVRDVGSWHDRSAACERCCECTRLNAGGYAQTGEQR